jgi:hypothetical protein
MADSRYLANRLKYHTASRIAQNANTALADTMNVDGHIVRTSNVWASPQKDFPLQADKPNADPVGATDDLVRVFKYGYEKTVEYNDLDSEGKKSFNWGTPVATSAAFIYTNNTAATPSATLTGGVIWTNADYPAV